MTIREVFKTDKQKLLNIYFTAGFPEKESLTEIIPATEQAGVDMVEIGIPYSDPLSDGPTIQDSSAIALSNGITIDDIFRQLGEVEVRLPLVMMGYFNVLLQYGVEKFCNQCEKYGVSGLILPDLPMEYYFENYEQLFKDHGISNIFLITPETSEDRIRLIDKYSEAFIYAVSSSSTTGSKSGIEDAESYLERINQMNLTTPVMVGFNIRSNKDFEFAGRYTRGAIIGSAYIKHISKSENLDSDTHKFVKSILK